MGLISNGPGLHQSDVEVFVHNHQDLPAHAGSVCLGVKAALAAICVAGPGVDGEVNLGGDRGPAGQGRAEGGPRTLGCWYAQLAAVGGPREDLGPRVLGIPARRLKATGSIGRLLSAVVVQGLGFLWLSPLCVAALLARPRQGDT